MDTRRYGEDGESRQFYQGKSTHQRPMPYVPSPSHTFSIIHSRPVNIFRIVRQPFTFSDGTYLPPGTHVAVALRNVHIDEANYSDPLSFQPFRYVDVEKNRPGNVGRKVNLTATHVDYLSFGYGRHACPGRFFAANELKLMLALMVMNYDVKLEGPRPENFWLVTTCIPNPRAEVLFRKRVPRDQDNM